LRRRVEEQGLACETLDAVRLTTLCQGGHHQGVVAEVAKLPVMDDRSLFDLVTGKSNPMLCVLDNIQGPRNLGACLRTAEAAGVDAVVLSRHDSCGITPVVRQVSAGAAELIPLARISNIVRVLTHLQKELGIWVVGTAGGSTRALFDIDLSAPLAMAFGSEGKGLKRLTLECCDCVGSIPMAGKIESLNVSVAVGIGLFESVRQRRSR
ncbi:23S rRNA (guanosine(2251)-2'-O)-methyltransferase RlmB, partial [Pseudomonadota bacterium]